MAKYPRQIHGPTFDEGNLKWSCVAIAVTPCSQSIKRISTEESQQRAKTKAESELDKGIRRHMKTCTKCPEDIRKKYR